MWHKRLRTLIAVAGLAIFAVAQAPSSFAAEIKDAAGFFTEKALDKANAEIAQLHKQTGKEVRIETFKTVPGGKADEVAKMDKADRERFFEKWARERATKERAKGIFILICKQPGHVEVEVDRQTRNQGFGAAERNQLRDKLLKGFRKDDHDGALLEGVDYISRTMKAKLPAHEVQRENRGADHGGQGAKGMGWLGWVIVAVIVLLGIRLISALFSGLSGNRPGYGGGYGPGPGYGGGGGGTGMFGSLMSGLFGAVAGNWLYHSFFGGQEHSGPSSFFGGGENAGDRSASEGAGQDFEGSGGDFDDRDDAGDGGGDSGGDFGGGDSGSGDFGGGDFGGGDFGGGDSGGGDF
ncbi:MAG TPA: TPM domain-containing protein [Planctomycetaceae bacterium]|nr:TPM domain-containing protein [Planctomycetaceae bacterium]